MITILWQFLARSLALLHVAIQYPSAYYDYIQRIDPVGGNYLVFSIFTTFIEPDVVKAYEAVLHTDKKFLLELSECEAQYIFAVISMFAPNDESRLPNFGRLLAKVEKRQKKTQHYSSENMMVRRTRKTTDNKMILSQKLSRR